MTYEEACMDAAARQMPTVWEHDEAMVREYAWQSGGGVMALRRDSVGGGFVLMSEGYARDDDMLVSLYSGDGCEGHTLIHTTDMRNAVWLFLNGAIPQGPGSCSCGQVYELA